MESLSNEMRQIDVSLYGNVENISETLSKCRVRIFYRGLNRNRTFISENFANELISSLPYAPIKGIFDKDALDYEDHGYDNTDGRIYGVVPENPNFAWEKHEDIDGIEREYACADVILFSALYPEANLISGKSQSMEIHRKGLTGEWKISVEDGQPYYEFEHGHLLGLQVLGDDTEPCFEGSAFFSLYKDAKDMFDYIRNYNKKGGEKTMENNFSKVSAIQNALNAESEKYCVTYVCDEYALAYDIEDQKCVRITYTEDGETLTIDKQDIYVASVTADEKAALDALQAIGTYAEVVAKVEALTTENTELFAQIEEFKKHEDDDDIKCEKKDETEEEDTEDKDKDKEDTGDKEDDEEEKKASKANHELEEKLSVAEAKVSEYETIISEKEAEIVRLNSEKEDIINEKLELETFKKEVETGQKSEILKEFSSHLTEEQVEAYSASMDSYSVADFKKEVCTAAYDSDASMFSKKESDEMIYKSENKIVESGALKLLNRHMKGGNK